MSRAGMEWEGMEWEGRGRDGLLFGLRQYTFPFSQKIPRNPILI